MTAIISGVIIFLGGVVFGICITALFGAGKDDEK